MKITKRQLRRIIKEEKARLFSESFSHDALSQFDKAIAYNKKQAASKMAPEDIEAYSDDAYSLEAIRDMAVQDKADDYHSGSESLRSMVSRLDTIVREQIPSEIYYWIIGEDY